jgi:hypothetical protein
MYRYAVRNLLEPIGAGEYTNLLISQGVTIRTVKQFSCGELVAVGLPLILARRIADAAAVYVIPEEQRLAPQEKQPFGVGGSTSSGGSGGVGGGGDVSGGGGADDGGARGGVQGVGASTTGGSRTDGGGGDIGGGDSGGGGNSGGGGDSGDGDGDGGDDKPDIGGSKSHSPSAGRSDDVNDANGEGFNRRWGGVSSTCTVPRKRLVSTLEPYQVKTRFQNSLSDGFQLVVPLHHGC